MPIPSNDHNLFMSLHRALDIWLPFAALDRRFIALDIYTTILLHDIKFSQCIWCRRVLDITSRDSEASYWYLAIVPRE